MFHYNNNILAVAGIYVCMLWCSVCYSKCIIVVEADTQFLRSMDDSILIEDDSSKRYNYKQQQQQTNNKNDNLIHALDPRLEYGGRWLTKACGKEIRKNADWPCSDIRFDVNVTQVNNDITIIWYGVNTRIRVSIQKYNDDDTTMVEQEQQYVFQGPTIWKKRMKSTIPSFSETGRFSVWIQKITTSCPFGPGIGGKVMGGSMFDFVGIETTTTTTTAIKILAPRKKERKIVAIGASDTAGWCIDGTPSTSAFDYALGGWKYEDCGKTYEAQLATKFQASLSVQAISGIGLTQNAQAKTPWILGSRTMPQYFNLTLQEENKNLWNFTKDGIVDLVIVSLGGNDYNHKKGDRLANDVFSNVYISFLQFLFHIYDDNVMTNKKTTKILSICGMGDPYEKKRNPDNDRCSPCPHVEAAVKQFQCTVPDQISNHLFYKFIPCDGSVVHGTNDIGCNGHKNSLGQQRVATFLEPTISNITG